MKYLLDTHALLWWLVDDKQLPRKVRSLIGDPANQVFVSSASAWEIATKFRLGKLPSAEILVQDIPGWVERAGFVELMISIRHAQRAGSFAQPHRDPFDRMLAAQSEMEGLSLITNDEALDRFGIHTVW